MFSERNTLLRLFVALLLTGCLPDSAMKIAYNDQPRLLNDGWVVSTPEAEGMDRAALEAAYRRFFDEDAYVTGISLLVVRNGALVAEGYCRALDDITRLNAIQSATKSFTSILTGMAIADGHITGVEQTLFELIPDAFPDDASDEARALTIEDALTMRTGIDLDNSTYSLSLLIDGQPDSLSYILSRPRNASPGTTFEYIDASPHLLAGALERAIGEPLEDYAARRLFAPLGITRWSWERYPDGVTLGAVGLHLTPRDLARVGQLMLQQGTWEGRELLPAAWVEDSTAPRVETDWAPEHDYRYGYYWWTVESLGAYTADGHGGQYIFVVPAHQLVIVMTAEPHTNGERVSINLDDFAPLATMIIEAVTDP